MWPKGNHARGIDVSHHRGVIDWKQVRSSGINFAIVKSTDGDSFIDSRFDFNWTQMRRAGMIRGAYHFYRPGVDPAAQANHYLTQVGDILHETDLSPVLDVEAYPQSVYDDFNSQSMSKRLQRIKTWLQLIANATGRLPIIYTNQHTWQSVLGNTEEFTHHPLWVANYGVTSPFVPANGWGGQNWTIWQFTYEGIVPGINGGKPPVDLNILNGTPSDLNDWLGIDGPRSIPPEVTNKQMMDALILAAKNIKANWVNWVTKMDLVYLIEPVSNAGRPYDGPAVEEFSLTAVEKNAILLALKEIQSSDPSPTNNLTNQEVINAFYKAAPTLGIAGWTMLKMAGLTDLVNARDALYMGPTVEEMPGLNEEQKKVLANALGLTWPVDLPENLPDEPKPEPEPTPIPEPEPEPEPVPEPQPDPEPEPEQGNSPPYPGLTNQEVINIFYKVADETENQGWNLIVKTGMQHLVEDRQGEYAGPAVEKMTGLTNKQRELLLEYLASEQEDSSGEVHYPGLVNQDMINIFYRAAAQFDENGWNWITGEGLGYMAATRQMRYQPYKGPAIEDLSTLGDDKHQAMLDALAVYQ